MDLWAWDGKVWDFRSLSIIAGIPNRFNLQIPPEKIDRVPPYFYSEKNKESTDNLCAFIVPVFYQQTFPQNFISTLQFLTHKKQQANWNFNNIFLHIFFIVLFILMLSSHQHNRILC